MRTGESDLATPDSKKEKIVASYTVADERRGQGVSQEDDPDWDEIDWSALESRSPMAPPNSIAVDGPIYDWLVARGADPEQRINEVLGEALKDSQSQSRSR
jgi:hypothetical protein